MTEAEEIVGRITTDGTIGFIVFNGLLGGVFGGAAYLLVRRFLPKGRVGGLLFGAALLVVFGTTIEPLRPDNPDFDIVGPAWLAIVLFVSMALAFGLTLQAVLARLSAALPLPAPNPRALAYYALPGVLAVVGFSISLVLFFVLMAVLFSTRSVRIRELPLSPRFTTGGRVVLGLALLVVLPNAVADIADIATRSTRRSTPDCGRAIGAAVGYSRQRCRARCRPGRRRDLGTRRIPRAR